MMTTRWTMSQIERAMEEFSGSVGDRADPRERRRLAIVEAATALFLRHGYRKTSVDEVAERAGIAKGTVYLYFKTKADLLVAAVVEEKKRYLQALRPVLQPDLPPRERLRTWIRLVFTLGPKMPLVSRLMRGDREMLTLLEEMDPEMRTKASAFQLDFLCDLLDPAAAPHRWSADELRDRAKVLLSLMLGLLGHFDERIREGLSVARYAGLLADMLVDGLAPARTGEPPSTSGGAP